MKDASHGPLVLLRCEPADIVPQQQSRLDLPVAVMLIQFSSYELLEIFSGIKCSITYETRCQRRHMVGVDTIHRLFSRQLFSLASHNDVLPESQVICLQCLTLKSRATVLIHHIV